jgi:hypothetical protein
MRLYDRRRSIHEDVSEIMSLIMHVRSTCHLSNTPSKYTTKRTSQRRRREEQRHAEPTFIPHIPLRDVEINPWEKPAFKHAEEYSRRHQARVVGHEALADHGERPEEHDERKPDGRACALHHHIRRYLCGYVERKKDGETVIVLEAVELEVSFEVVETGVADVGAVKKAEPVVHIYKISSSVYFKREDKAYR